MALLDATTQYGLTVTAVPSGKLYGGPIKIQTGNLEESNSNRDTQTGFFCGVTGSVSATGDAWRMITFAFLGTAPYFRPLVAASLSASVNESLYGAAMLRGMDYKQPDHPVHFAAIRHQSEKVRQNAYYNKPSHICDTQSQLLFKEGNYDLLFQRFHLTNDRVRHTKTLGFIVFRIVDRVLEIEDILLSYYGFQLFEPSHIDASGNYFALGEALYQILHTFNKAVVAPRKAAGDIEAAHIKCPAYGVALNGLIEPIKRALRAASFMPHDTEANPAVFAWAVDIPFCSSCGATNTESKPLSACSQCNGVMYCSRECQIAALPEHKKVCTTPKRAPTPADNNAAPLVGTTHNPYSNGPRDMSHISPYGMLAIDDDDNSDDDDFISPHMGTSRTAPRPSEAIDVVALMQLLTMQRSAHGMGGVPMVPEVDAEDEYPYDDILGTRLPPTHHPSMRTGDAGMPMMGGMGRPGMGGLRGLGMGMPGIGGTAGAGPRMKTLEELENEELEKAIQESLEEERKRAEALAKEQELQRQQEEMRKFYEEAEKKKALRTSATCVPTERSIAEQHEKVVEAAVDFDDELMAEEVEEDDEEEDEPEYDDDEEEEEEEEEDG